MQDPTTKESTKVVIALLDYPITAIPIALRAHELGCKLVVLTTSPAAYDWMMDSDKFDYPDFRGFNQALSRVYLLESFDLDRTFNLALQVSEEFEVCGVLTWVEERVILCSLIADALNLPNCGLKAAYISRNKHLQRKILSGTPWVVSSQKVEAPCTSVDLAATGVLKPLDRSGSVGVRIWRDPKSRADAFNALKSSRGQYLVEDFVDGQEYSAEIWVQNGERKLHFVTRKGTLVDGDSVFPVETSHEVGYQLDRDLDQELTELIDYIVNASSIRDSCVHLEFKVNSDRQLKVMEWAVRMAGDRIFDTYYHSGLTDPFRNTLQVATGKRLTPAEPQAEIRCAKQIYFTIPEDKAVDLQSLKGLDVVYWRHARRPYFDFRNKGQRFAELEHVSFHEIAFIHENGKMRNIVDSSGRHYWVVISWDSKQCDPSEDTIRTLLEKRFMRPLADGSGTPKFERL